MIDIDISLFTESNNSCPKRAVESQSFYFGKSLLSYE